MAADLIPLTPLVAHLSSGTWPERSRYGTPYLVRLEPGVLADFGNAFAGDQGLATLLQAVARAAPREARASFELLEGRGAPPLILVEAAFSSGDVLLQRKALTISEARPDLNEQAVQQALRSPFAEMRRVALERIAVSEDEGSGNLLQEALFDPSESVRSLARFLLKKRGGQPAHLYREVLVAATEPRTIAACLLALAELDRDWLSAADYLKDTNAQVRSAAARAIGYSDSDVAREVLPPLLADPSPAVSAAARQGLSRAAPLDLHELGSIPERRSAPCLSKCIATTSPNRSLAVAVGRSSAGGIL